MILIPCKFLSSSGSVDEKLRKACLWVAKFCPGRTLTLEQIGSIMEFPEKGLGKLNRRH